MYPTVCLALSLSIMCYSVLCVSPKLPLCPLDHPCTACYQLKSDSACAGVLLIKAVQQWHEEHKSALPGSAKEKAAFRSMLKSWQRHIDGIPLEVPWLSSPGLPCQFMLRHGPV